MQSDLSYYRQRQAAEIAAAAAAQDVRVSAIHREMARIYEKRISSLNAHSSFELHLISAA
jgi:hypothetical protein